MKRNASLVSSLVVATGLTLASFAASADDSSMSVLTGDSYAYFDGLEFRLGEFNRPSGKTAVAGDSANRGTDARGRARLPFLLAGPMPDRFKLPRDKARSGDAMKAPGDTPKAAPRVFVPSPFRDDTGA